MLKKINAKKYAVAVMDECCSFPCPACGKEEGDGRNFFCKNCLNRICLVRPPRCSGCGGPLDGVLELCSKCMEFEQRPWQGALALFELNGLGQNLVHRFKFYNSPEMARPFAVLGAELLNNTNWSLDAIVPVPLHWTRCFVRGYNQAALYCEELARRTGVKYLPALSRIKRTRQQAKLGRDERRKNLKGAFSIKKTADIAGKAVLLIDDVMTTGATLTAAAETLLDSGASSVYIMVIGRR